MGVFDTELKSTAEYFLDTFGEQITYHPAEGDPRQIKAIIDRDAARGTDAPPSGYGPAITVTIANDAEMGVAITDLDTGRDKIELAVRIGDDPQQRSLGQIISQDAGMFTVGVR